MASHTSAGGHVVAGGIPGESAIIPTRTSCCSARTIPTSRIEPRRVHRRLWSSPAAVESDNWIPHATTVSCLASNSTGVSIPSAL